MKDCMERENHHKSKFLAEQSHHCSHCSYSTEQCCYKHRDRGGFHSLGSDMREDKFRI